MLRLDLDRVRANVRDATTEDLLDRATVYRSGMEPEALEIIDEELRRRGVSWDDLADHTERRQGVILGPEGWAQQCQWCRKPAVARSWGWYRLYGLIPVLPRLFPHCEDHHP
jgi:hypothetical protein